MKKTDLVYLFTRNGMGHAPGSSGHAPGSSGHGSADLQTALAKKLLTLTLQSGELPARILFYTDGVRLACEGSPVLDELRALETAGVELILCQTCLVTYGLLDQVRVGIVGGMGDILQTLQQAPRVASL